MNSSESVKNPTCILLFSGKRKSGKDYITDKLLERLGGNAALIKLSGPIKSHWAEVCKLDLSELLGNSTYKEKYRKEMIKWSEEIRSKDPGYFCQAALEMYDAANKQIWIISDARRKTDLTWFYEHYGTVVKTIRVLANENIRKERGWVFTEGVDDVTSECDLDDYNNWDYEFENNGNPKELEIGIQVIINLIKSCTGSSD